MSSLSPSFTFGPTITLATRAGLGWRCAACPFDMTGLTHREALEHFATNHGTEADANLARRDFPGMSISGQDLWAKVAE